MNCDPDRFPGLGGVLFVAAIYAAMGVILLVLLVAG